MLATTGVDPDPNLPDLGLAAGFVVRLPAPDSFFPPLHLTVDGRV